MPAPVTFVNESGVRLEADAEDFARIQALQDSGFRPETEEEVNARLEREALSTPSAQLETALTTAASDLTFGGSDVLTRALSPETADRWGQLREANEGATWVGHGLGAAALLVPGLGEVQGARLAGEGIAGARALGFAGGLSTRGTALGLGRVLTAPTRGLARLGEIASEGVGAGARALGVTGETLGGRALLRGAQGLASGVVEGAGMGLGQALSESALAPGGDYQHFAERALADVKDGALFGGVLSGGLGALGGAASRGIESLTSRIGSGRSSLARRVELTGDSAVDRLRAATELSQKTGKSVADFLEAAPGTKLAEQLESVLTPARRDGLSELSAALIDGDAELVRKLAPWNVSPEARTLRAKLAKSPEAIEGASRSLRDDVTQLVDDSQKVFDEARGATKVANIDRLLDPRAKARQIEAATEELTRVEREFGALDIGGLGEVAKEHTAIAKLIRNSRDQMREAKTAAEAFRIIDSTKRELQKFADSLAPGFADMGLKKIQAQAFSDAIEGIQERTRQFLESDVWGRAGQAQAAVNAKWSKLLNESRRKFFEQFTTVTGREYRGRAIHAADGGKVDSFVRSLGSARGDDAERYLRGYVRDARDLADEMLRSLEFDGANANRVKSIRDAADRIERTLDDTTDVIRIRNRADELRARESATGSIVGGMIGGGILGAPGAAIGSAVGSALTRPVSTGEAMSRLGGLAQRTLNWLGPRAGSRSASALAGLAEAAGRTETRIQRSTRGWFRGTREATPSRASGAALAARAATVRSLLEQESRTDRALRKKREETRAAAYQRTVDRLSDVETRARELLANPDPEAPATSSAVARQRLAAVDYLRKHIPAGLGVDPLLPRRSMPAPDPVSVERFARRVQIADDPLSIYDELEDRSVTPEHADTLRALYPRLFADIQGAIQDELVERQEPLSSPDRVTLTTLFGLLDGARIAANQAVYQAPTTPKSQRPPMASGGQTRIAKDSETDLERIGAV